jgi:hypothetical protein
VEATTSNLLQRFIKTFEAAIDGEMRSMQERLGPFEIPLAAPRRAGDPDAADGELYAFDMPSTSRAGDRADERLVPGLECTLRHDGGEIPVTVITVGGGEVVVASQREIRLDRVYTLVVYPWFLYERLKETLASLPDSSGHFTESALRLFGKIPPRRRERPPAADHRGLNDSQLAAVRLASESDLSFIWGPPGTGKTHTLGHVVAELIRHGERVLITSTTNAAVDRALAKLASIGETAGLLERGLMIRIGQRSDETDGADLREATKRQNEHLNARADRMRMRIEELRSELDRTGRLAAMVEAATSPLQFDIFRETTTAMPDAAQLLPLFGSRRAARLASMEAAELKPILDRHRKRLEAALRLARGRVTAAARELRDREGSAVARASVILATMTNLYLSPLLRDERFDAVIIEEAGMATLPALFHAAAMARRRVIVVGDPQQLPPIVQSNDDYVRRAMGRNIFAVTVPHPFESAEVALLDTQYRMHPEIGRLVSELYYDGRLCNGEGTERRREIASRSPFPGEAVIVVDAAGAVAESGSRGSRRNETTAHLAVDLAVQGIAGGLDSVAIITPYVDQARLIRELLGHHRNEAARIECRTVHRFQGSERDMVILDTVDAPPLRPGTLLASRGADSSARNLINVGISRARGKLIVIANLAYFRAQAPGTAITEMLARAAENGRCVPAGRL